MEQNQCLVVSASKNFSFNSVWVVYTIYISFWTDDSFNMNEAIHRTSLIDATNTVLHNCKSYLYLIIEHNPPVDKHLTSISNS